MNSLTICPDCSGYVPASAPCPHCAAAAPPARPSRAMRLLKRSLMFVAGGAMTVTIAACYGAPCSSSDGCDGGEVTSVSVQGGDTVVVGSDLQLTAIATFDDGSTFDATSTAIWTTNSAGIATVIGGVVTGVAAGSAVITATQDSASGFTTITVTPAFAAESVETTFIELSRGGDGPG